MCSGRAYPPAPRGVRDYPCGDVAQMVERMLCMHQVLGSMPSISSWKRRRPPAPPGPPFFSPLANVGTISAWIYHICSRNVLKFF